MPGTRHHLKVAHVDGAVVFAHHGTVGATEWRAVLTVQRVRVGTRTYRVAVLEGESLPIVVDAIVDASAADREACRVG